MQNKTNKKKPQVQEVKKPIITGSWHGKHAWSLAGKRALNMLAVTAIYLIGGMLLGFDGIAGRIFSCVMIVFAAAYYLYASGLAQGQTDAAFGEILYSRRENGHNVPAEDIDRSFHPLKGLFAVVVGAVPFVLFTLVFACITKVTVYQLGALPGWMDSLVSQTEVRDALCYYEALGGMKTMDVLRIIDRAMIMPFINVAAYFGAQASLLAERLSPLLILVAPMGYALGYSQGLNLRTRINTGIKMGDEKKKRRERKARKQRQRSKSPEQLI